MSSITDEKPEAFPVILRQVVLWGDMDAFGHVNNTVYFRYFEDARMAYFERTGMQRVKDEIALGPILANTRCDFRLPLEYPDDITIVARASIVGPKKLLMQYGVYSERHAALAAEGEGLIVFYDYDKGRSTEIPAQLVEAISVLESGSHGR